MSTILFGCVLPARASPSLASHANEVTCSDDSRSLRDVRFDGPQSNVRYDLAALPRVARHPSAGPKMSLTDSLEGRKALDGRIPLGGWRKGEPSILPSTTIVIALGRSVERSPTIQIASDLAVV